MQIIQSESYLHCKVMKKRRAVKESTKYIIERILPSQIIYCFRSICQLLICFIILKIPDVLRREIRVTHVSNNLRAQEEARFSKWLTQIYMHII